ncbi:hypothetical protein C8J57DRAFT_1071129, partial [Mycena rebaudengoi]
PTPSPKAQPRQTPSISVPVSQPRPKRKHTASVPPSTATESPPPSKRVKMTPPAVMHEKHWTLDGNIVIQIEHTKFKLHQSHLVKHSDWFSDFFEGKPTPEDEYVERGEDGSTDLLILTIPGLTAKDFIRLLDGFDWAITYVRKPPAFSKIAGILRASTALAFPDFRDWATDRLEEQWSPHLADLSTTPIPHATESIILARACDVPSALKRAMYELVRLAGFGQPTDAGRPRLSSTGALVNARERLTTVWMTTIAPYSPDLVTCAAATAEDAPILDDVAPPPGGCTSTDPLRSWKAHQKLVRESGLVDAFVNDPVCGLQALMDADWGKEGYCVKCVEQRRAVWGERREKVWGELDGWFGLGGDGVSQRVSGGRRREAGRAH